MDPDATPRVNYRHESGNHGERIARLESDVFNITQLISGDVHEKLTALQAGVDTIKQVLGDGHVLFQKLEDAHANNAKDIATMKAERQTAIIAARERRNGRLFYLVYPIIIGILLIAADVIVKHL